MGRLRRGASVQHDATASTERYTLCAKPAAWQRLGEPGRVMLVGRRYGLSWTGTACDTYGAAHDQRTYDYISCGLRQRKSGMGI